LLRVLDHRRGGHASSPGVVFGRLLKRAGLRRLTLHDSRHTTLTLMEHAGVPISTSASGQATVTPRSLRRPTSTPATTTCSEAAPRSPKFTRSFRSCETPSCRRWPLGLMTFGMRGCRCGSTPEFRRRLLHAARVTLLRCCCGSTPRASTERMGSLTPGSAMRSADTSARPLRGASPDGVLHPAYIP
jgi:hypothetical protein